MPSSQHAQVVFASDEYTVERFGRHYGYRSGNLSVKIEFDPILPSPAYLLFPRSLAFWDRDAWEWASSEYLPEADLELRAEIVGRIKAALEATGAGVEIG